MKHFKTSILASAMCLAVSAMCQTTSAQIKGTERSVYKALCPKIG